MSVPSSHPQSLGKRRASSFKPVERLLVDQHSYPNRCSSAVGGLHDLRYYQGILSCSENFSESSSCQVFEVLDGIPSWHQLNDEETTWKYFEVCQNEILDATQLITISGRCKYQITSNSGVPCHASLPVQLEYHRFFRRALITNSFCNIERAPQTSFGSRLSLSSTNAQTLLRNIDACPQLINNLFGEPDYWAPSSFTSHDGSGVLQRLEFSCQQPRWNIHKNDVPWHKKVAPWSIYMNHHVTTSCTCYVVACSSEQAQLQVVKERLHDAFTLGTSSDVMDPYFLHSLITHEAFLEAKSIITELRYKLYDQLDRVDDYSHQTPNYRDKRKLEEVTILFHVISQDLDSMAASADMAGMIVRRMIDSHNRYVSCAFKPEMQNALAKTMGALDYLLESIESQKRWLLSYKARKDIAMNLVFNLVTQQEFATSATIAREAKADGASMKIIVALTMVFLPGTFLSSVFGMTMLDDVKWSLYVALTLPLTVLVIGIWLAWFYLPSARHRVIGQWRSRTQRSADGKVSPV